MLFSRQHRRHDHDCLFRYSRNRRQRCDLVVQVLQHGADDRDIELPDRLRQLKDVAIEDFGL